MVFTDSCLALSMNEQVFTTITSASAADVVSSAPELARMPIITSLSTRFLGQPKLTKPTLVRTASTERMVASGKESAPVRPVFRMVSDGIDSLILSSQSAAAGLRRGLSPYQGEPNAHYRFANLFQRFHDLRLVRTPEVQELSFMASH